MEGTVLDGGFRRANEGVSEKFSDDLKAMVRDLHEMEM